MRRSRRLPIEQLAPYLFPDAPRGDTGPPIDWPAVFDNDHPVEIEIGFGKGLFLTTDAAAKPDTNFFGIEIVRKYQLFTATRLAAQQLTNVRVACTDARAMLRDRVRPSSVQAVHVYFPDPWWKTRHQKRKLFTPEFAASVGNILEATGRFHIVTDVEEYFQVMMKIMTELAIFEAVSPSAPTEAKHDLDYLTNFERKFRKEGRPIYRAAFAKRKNAG